MTDRKMTFYSHRYLITPMTNQTTLHEVIGEKKESFFGNLIKELYETTKTVWNKGDRKYLIYGYQNRKHIYILKYAKISNENILVEGDIDLESENIESAKFIYIIIDLAHQIILIQKKSTVFQEVSSAANILAEFFREEMKKYNYVVNIYPLTTNIGFWKYVYSADKIFELTMTLSAPNMAFLGSSDTKKVLEIIKSDTNNEEIEIGLKNNEGNLQIIKETLGNWIDYIRTVGGRYRLRFKKNEEEEETITSDNDISKTKIIEKNDEKYTDEEIDLIENKLKAIHLLETRIDEEDDEGGDN